MLKQNPFWLSLFLIATTLQTNTFAEEKAPLHPRTNEREPRKYLCDNREYDLEYLKQHQAAVRELEAIGYALKYEQHEHMITKENVIFNTSAAAYIRNSLAKKVEIPVVAIQPRFFVFHDPDYIFGRTDKISFNRKKSALDKLTVELILPFTQLLVLNIANSNFTLKEIEQLQSLPHLEVLILSSKMLEPEQQAKIQRMLPHCELKNAGEAHSGGW